MNKTHELKGGTKIETHQFKPFCNRSKLIGLTACVFEKLIRLTYPDLKWKSKEVQSD